MFSKSDRVQLVRNLPTWQVRVKSCKLAFLERLSRPTVSTTGAERLSCLRLWADKSIDEAAMCRKNSEILGTMNSLPRARNPRQEVSKSSPADE